MDVSFGLLTVGLVLASFGAVGVLKAGEIVEKQREEGMSAFADGTIDDRTRVRVTRTMAGVFLVAGLALVVYGVGIL